MPRPRCNIDYDAIPGLLAEGETADAIAARFGTTRGSLAVQCSKRKISLCGPNGKRTRPKVVPRSAMEKPLELSEPTLELFKEKARAMKRHPAALARDLIEIIVQDDLYAAILDEQAA